MNELPDGWIETTIGEVAEYVARGKSPKYAEKSSLPVINQKAIRWNGIQKEHLKFIHEDQIDQWGAERFIKQGDILWNSTGTGTMGRACLVRAADLDPPKVVDSHVTIIRPTPGIIDSRFLFAWIRGPQVQDSLEELASGSTNQIELNRSTVVSIRLPLAPLPEQERIANRLDPLLARVEACRDGLNRAGVILESFRSSVLAAATRGHLTRDWREEHNLPREWPIVELKNVASDFSYGSSSKSSKVGEIPVLRMGNIQGGVLDWQDLVYTSDPAEIKKYKLSPGEVLFNRTNSPELVGKSAVYWGEREAIFAGYLIRVRCGEALLPDYLNYCLGSPAGREYCRAVKSDGVSQSNINAKKLAAFAFELPSVAEQREIVRRVKELLALSGMMEVKRSRAATLVDNLIPSILAKAFRGELVSQESRDMPASVILNKLKGDGNVESAAPPRKRSKKPVGRSNMKNVDKDSIKEVILKLEANEFSFDELRAKLGGDYEFLKTALFDLLQEPTPIVRQVFDVNARAMRLVRVIL
ncbi:restriction endonuclease subunit S [Cupriavidus numazuensis]|uniref:Type-1 restriction enzyme EcoKI specificity protein n=1 Tax=Cupriavidus numazuensis TaxID=221992 RepID=A0ABM8TI07_9BURK|nr:restriction endonuclease subunit S [Cupriavidus numazuensis]CAG2147618.1 Type-1 restriction enzyme EcoKI specificity protein [Cupriavidus numazuensis]